MNPRAPGEMLCHPLTCRCEMCQRAEPVPFHLRPVDDEDSARILRQYTELEFALGMRRVEQ